MIDENNSFLGIGWSFPPEFPRQGAAVQMASGDEDVRQSLLILLQTAKYTRLMQPEFYCDLAAFAFQQNNRQNQAKIKGTIAEAILNNEPRVDCGKINISVDPIQPDILQIEVNYRVRSTNSRQNIVFPFYLDEGNEVASLQGGGN